VLTVLLLRNMPLAISLLVRPIAKISVGVVQANRHVAQAHLPRAWFADFDVFVAQDLRPSGFVETYRFGHANLPSCSFLLNSKLRLEGQFRPLRNTPLIIGRQRFFSS
jgi:hypothetical protein